MENAYLEFRTHARRSQRRPQGEPSLKNLQLATLVIACLMALPLAAADPPADDVARLVRAEMHNRINQPSATPCLGPEALPASQFFSVEDEKN
jgi:hypothetical protein